jgi:hypothetical protein
MEAPLLTMKKMGGKSHRLRRPVTGAKTLDAAVANSVPQFLPLLSGP